MCGVEVVDDQRAGDAGGSQVEVEITERGRVRADGCRRQQDRGGTDGTNNRVPQEDRSARALIARNQVTAGTALVVACCSWK